MFHRASWGISYSLFFSFWFIAQGQETPFEKAESYFFTHKDSSAYYFDLAYKKAIDSKDLISAFDIATWQSGFFSFHRERTKEKKVLSITDSLYLLLADRLDSTSYGKELKYYHWYNKGSYYYSLYNYDRARKFFFKILKEIPSNGNIDDNANSNFETTANSFIATTYRNELKFGLAEEFYNENLKLHLKYDHGDETIYDTKNLIASLKAQQKKFRFSNKLAKESITWLLDNYEPGLENSFFSTNVLVINNYLRLKEPDSAQYYVDLVKKKFPDGHSFKADLALMEAGIAKQKGEFDASLAHYYHAMEYSLEKGIGDEIASVFKEIGDLHYDNKNYEKALDAFLKASAYFGVGSETVATESKALNRIGLFPILLGLSKTYGLQGTAAAQENQMAIGHLAIKELLQLKITFYDDADKQVLVENVLPIFENSFEACYQQYQRTKNTAYIDTAFVIFERSKGNVLLDALQRNRASQFSGVPADLLEQEKILKISIADAERSAQQGDSLGASSLFELRRQHESLLSLLEQEHPNYYRLKYNNTLPGLDEFQNSLRKRQTAVSYFLGDKAVYVVQVSKNEKALYKVPFTNLDLEQISAFKRDLGNPNSNLQALNKRSFALYQKFLAPFLEASEAEHLLLIPDGILQTLPFGALNTDDTIPTYLIEDYGIAYANSASLWMQLDAPKNYNPNYLAMAPGFRDKVLVNDIAFAPLPNSSREVDALSNYFEGTVLKDAQATAFNFKKALEKHSILHLATHARINDEFPEYSFLTFMPNGGDPGMLYINDLYAMDVDADLVTLSACDTGLGEIQKGEGAMSLARAFFYSGANSLVQTSWSINDGSTPEIMDVFYGQLAQGSTKDRALQQAKLVFLEKHKENKYAHPYYWSAFLLSGNTAPLVSTWHLVWYHYLIFGLVLVSVFLFLWRKKLI